MPLVTSDDVRAGFLTRWAAVPELNGIIAAEKVYEGRAAEGTAPPYARLVTTEGTRELMTGAVYLQRFNVRVEAFTLAEGGTPSIRTALDAAFAGTSAAPAAGLAVTSGSVIHSKGLPGGSTAPTYRRIDGKDVNQVTAYFEILVQGNRG